MSGEQRRWPSSVYGVGREPDPRFTLANERTFLAWIRTTLALLAASAAVDALDLPMAGWLQRLLAVLLALIGLVSAVLAWTGWAATERALRRGEPLPASRASLPLVAVAVLVGIVLVVAPFTRG